MCAMKWLWNERRNICETKQTLRQRLYCVFIKIFNLLQRPWSQSHLSRQKCFIYLLCDDLGRVVEVVEARAGCSHCCIRRCVQGVGTEEWTWECVLCNGGTADEHEGRKATMSDGITKIGVSNGFYGIWNSIPGTLVWNCFFFCFCSGTTSTVAVILMDHL